MEFDHYVATLRREGASFAEALTRAPLDRPVPTCPGWTLRDLTRHLGGIHRWAAGYVGEARREYWPVDIPDVVGAWPDDEHLAGWFVEGHEALVATLLAAPEDLECFTFLPAPSPRLMWTRRQVHETAIHRADAESVSGPITACPSDLAADGIDELLTCFLVRRGRGPKTDAPYTMRVDPDDVDAVWSMRIAPASYEVERGHRSADVAVSAPASDLYHFLWNRLDASAVAVEGDGSLLERWREGARVRWG